MADGMGMPKIFFLMEDRFVILKKSKRVQYGNLDVRACPKIYFGHALTCEKYFGHVLRCENIFLGMPLQE